ncbi:RNase RNM [Obesumbacterium proteus]|uniref:RNase RNM n=1 Tax=Obesumbacterium proteus TaxID=82983 RepID=UPI001F3B5EA0|nr:PHP domain-containing protein [Obesumbacterium proteus]MCE9886121.1 PHP domain-containing protein [Obesumbacterium proteus]MCE9918067.1 PHP domain-containing protein [Obesumbacterium proteus]MCE9930860.1 PHP domain-containing protein [Obesumbacterium proteus]MCG2878827.1 PHP domain-containing protein [Obesumbacterium proteus]
MAILQDTLLESEDVTLSPQPLFDLHSHTTASDGLLSSAELVSRAAEMGVTTLAITDHDTTAGIPAARQAIVEQGLELELIAGVEISTLWENHEIHIVGLNVDTDSAELQTLLSEQVTRRQARAKEIALRLEKARIPGALEGATRIADGAEITRGHFARYLVEQGYATNVGGVFKHYLARGKTGYAPPQWCTIEEAIVAIHHAGGQAVVAHPGRYQLSNKWLKRLLADFKSWGGDAMEVAQCQQAPNERSQLAAYALQFGLLASQGSDFHQPCAWIELGRKLWLPTGVEPVWRDW